MQDGTTNDESHVRTQPLRVRRIAGQPREAMRVEPVISKAAANETVPADRLIGRRYRLCARLGRGRLGVIYQALDELSRGSGAARSVAVQLIAEKLVAREGFAGEFGRGAAALQAISHPNIVQLLESGRDGSRYFFVMELLESASLRFVLDEVTALPIEETTAIVRAVGDALQYLHAKAVVHGNLKPENVVVTFDYQVKLLDVVPPGWQDLDSRDDVYGLACLIYELLAGKHPFNANSPLEARRAGLEPRPIANLPPRQWQALARALALDRDARTPTVAQFLDEFGVTGMERLRSIVSAGAEARPPPAPTAWPQVVPLTAERFRQLRPKRRRAVRSFLLLLLMISLGALAYLENERLRDGATELMTVIDAGYRDEANAGPAKATDEAAAVPPPDADAQTGDAVAPGTAPPMAGVAPEAAPTVASAPEMAAAPQPRFSFAEPVARVSEGEVAARIVIQRSGRMAGKASVVWWSREDTALADEDYADLGRRVEKFGPGERSRTVYVPLINDRAAEPTERFNVYLGHGETGPGGLAPDSGMRVDIVDDD